MSAGAEHTCALLEPVRGGPSVVRCFGRNDEGQCDGVPGPDVPRPRAAPLVNATFVATGGRHTCALAGDRLGCWGSNAVGALGGIDAHARVVTTARRPFGFEPVALALGDAHTCARGASQAACVGDNMLGQLGPSCGASFCGILEVGGFAAAGGRFAAGSGRSCHASGSGVVCYGSDRPGGSIDRATQVTFTEDVRGVSVGATHACAWGDVLRCWGDDSFGQLGDGEPLARSDVPVTIELGRPPTSVSCGGSLLADLDLGRARYSAPPGAHTGAVAAASVWCWGDNSRGQLGDGTTRSSASPVRALVEDAVTVSAGSLHTCAVTEDGELYCWGDGSRGQLGLGVSGMRATPTRVEW